MLDIPKQSRDGLHQLFIDIKGLATQKPISEVPLVIKEHPITLSNVVSAIIYATIFGAVAGVGYILITNPAGFIAWLVGIWNAILGGIR